MKSFVSLLVVMLLLVSAEASQRKTKTEKKATAQTATQASTKVDVNSASQSELEAINGVGPATAKKIIANRPYSSVDDLKKAGLTQARIDKMRDSFTVVNAGAGSARGSSKKASAPASSSTNGTSASTGGTDSKKPSMWDRLRGKKASDQKSSPSTTPASSASPPGSSSSSTSPGKSASATAPASSPAPGGGNGKVWVNKDTKVFHREGDRWYGKTKDGEYMTEPDAIAAGYRPVKERKK